MPHILLLSESIGSGHERAASAIEEALLAAGEEVRVTRLNLLDTFRPLTAKVTRGLYFQALAHTPKLWGKWYEWQREKKWNGLSRRVVHGVLQKDVGRFVRELAPDAVVCTHPLPACLLAEMKSKGLGMGLCTVVTDFDLHGYWLHPQVDLFCVPVREMQEEIHAGHGMKAAVQVTGIPIARAFGELAEAGGEGMTPSRSEGGQGAGQIEVFGADANPGGRFSKRVLISGGGSGVGVLPMVEATAERLKDGEITVVCGHNRELYRELKRMYPDQLPGTSHIQVQASVGDLMHSFDQEQARTRASRESRGRATVTVLGYSREMHRLMAEHDLLLTKPGGLTVSEALAMRLPMVLYTPIQGQEQRNGQLMARLGAAKIARDPQDGAQVAERLLREEAYRQQMIRNMEAIRRPFAAQSVAAEVLALAAAGRQAKVYRIDRAL